MRALFSIKTYPYTVFTCLLVLVFYCFTYSDTVLAAGLSDSTKTADSLSASKLRMVVRQGDFSYENATLVEDVTWRGTVVIRGALVISPQTTVRIESGTVIRFYKSAILRQAPRMVIMGRLQCNGKPDKPVVFRSGNNDAAKGDWGGLLFVATEKRNQMDHFRIEGAETAIEAHYSHLTINGANIRSSGTGILLHDSVLNLLNIDMNGLDTALEAHNSEVDLRDGTVINNYRGIVAKTSTIAVTSVVVSGSKLQGLVIDECRIRIRSCEFSGNTFGVSVTGGEGQIFWSRFVNNSELGLELTGARIKVTNSLFTENQRDGIKVNDSRSLIFGNSFIKNGGYNLINSSKDNIIAVQNWWNSTEESVITEKIAETVKNSQSGKVVISPWLIQKPSLLP